MAKKKDEPPKPEYTLKYSDSNHSYYLNGTRCKSVSKVAKIVTDGYAIEKWSERQVAIGMTVDPDIRENVATHIDNDTRLNEIVADAKKAAKAHRKADRGTQKHRVFELVLLGEDHRLITEQQAQDAECLKRTLDHYKLTPHMNLAEQFVIWPGNNVAGRFDAILEWPDGRLILVDLKTGMNAVKYPQSTSAQLALYARAPWISEGIHTEKDKSEVTVWRKHPEQLDRQTGYVLLAEPGDKQGVLYPIDLNHGWAGARKALELVDWRKAKKYGDEIVGPPVEGWNPRPAPATWESLIAGAQSVERLRELWTRIHELGEMTQERYTAMKAKAEELKGAAA